MFICFLLLQNKLQQALMTCNKTYFLHSPESVEAHMGCTGFSAQHLSKLESKDELSKILKRTFLQMLIQVLGRIQFFAATRLRPPVFIKCLTRTIKFLIFHHIFRAVSNPDNEASCGGKGCDPSYSRS